MPLATSWLTGLSPPAAPVRVVAVSGCRYGGIDDAGIRLKDSSQVWYSALRAKGVPVVAGGEGADLIAGHETAVSGHQQNWRGESGRRLNRHSGQSVISTSGANPVNGSSMAH
jgi:hypothetical protein